MYGFVNFMWQFWTLVKLRLFLAFAEFRSIIKQVLAWPFKNGLLDYRFSNLEIKDTGKKWWGVSVLWKSGTGSWHW